MEIELSHIFWLLAGIGLATLARIIFKNIYHNTPSPVQTDAQKEDASWAKVLQMMEDERERISSDLHDELGTLISTLYLDVELLSMDTSLSPEAEKRVLEIK